MLLPLTGRVLRVYLNQTQAERREVMHKIALLQRQRCVRDTGFSARLMTPLRTEQEGEKMFSGIYRYSCLERKNVW